MTTTFESRTLSIGIKRSPREVYDFVANPENMPQWATGLGSALAPAGDAWIAETPDGPVKVVFTPRNDFGVLDHYVHPPSGAAIYVPMRLLANGQGSEITFTLFRLPAMSDAKFAADAAWVERDLRALKQLLEASGRDPHSEPRAPAA